VAQDQEPGAPGCHADREGEARFLLPRPWSPLLIGEGSRLRGPLTDLAVDLAAKSAGFRRSLLPGVLTALAGSSALDELLLQQFDRGTRHAPCRY
jgi:hypothetical protein